MLISFVEAMKLPSVTQQEHRAGVNKKGKAYIYDTPEITDARQLFRAHLAPHKPDEPFSGPVELDIRWLYNDEDGKHQDGEFKITKPDLSNLVKLIEDEMTRLGFWKDDSQVALVFQYKIWKRGFEGVGITVRSLPDTVREAMRL